MQSGSNISFLKWKSVGFCCNCPRAIWQGHKALGVAELSSVESRSSVPRRAEPYRHLAQLQLTSFPMPIGEDLLDCIWCQGPGGKGEVNSNKGRRWSAWGEASVAFLRCHQLYQRRQHFHSSCSPLEKSRNTLNTAILSPLLGGQKVSLFYKIKHVSPSSYCFVTVF